MEGSLFINPERPSRAPELVCADCGTHFRPRRITDGVEEVCGACLEQRFPASFPNISGLTHRHAHAVAAD